VQIGTDIKLLLPGVRALPMIKIMVSERTSRLFHATVILATCGLVYSWGVCPGGCLEENYWYAVAHSTTGHNHEQHHCPWDDSSHECGCDFLEDIPLSTQARDLVAAPEVDWFVPAVFLLGVNLSATAEKNIAFDLSKQRLPQVSLRAHAQLFRC